MQRIFYLRVNRRWYGTDNNWDDIKKWSITHWKVLRYKPRMFLLWLYCWKTRKWGKLFKIPNMDLIAETVDKHQTCLEFERIK